MALAKVYDSSWAKSENDWECLSFMLFSYSVRPYWENAYYYALEEKISIVIILKVKVPEYFSYYNNTLASILENTSGEASACTI